MEDIFLCARIGVDCVKDDDGKYLGFIFNVKRDDADDMIVFIKEKLNEYHVPYDDVYVFCSVSLPLVMITDKESIENEIKVKSEILNKKSEENSRKK
jgi:hypothetical protein